ncbi:hypothetical protein BDN70DRAFT_886403 [Pholiota conissans]|uniref:F-box domain-containing protein n=1 Tax=Pholiota conissans TaxID=109636 RepID=A0A9P6CUU9_9AGAR|nr:hypothetical protein BDN70DRAFT_886403 [Pholiota conissans]
MSALPLDVLDPIVEHVAQGDNNTLSSTKACSLVCRTFLPACRRRIFGYIALNDNYSYEESSPHFAWPRQNGNLSKFLRLLLKSPHIGEYIRSLTYRMLHDTVDWTGVDIETFSRAFERITRLEYLTFIRGYEDEHDPPVDWTDNPLCPALRRLMYLPTLVGFTVYNCANFKLADIVQCRQLKELDMHLLHLNSSIVSAESLPTSPLSLRKMHIGRRSMPVADALLSIRCADGEMFINMTEMRDLSFVIRTIDTFSTVRCLIEKSIRLSSLSISLDIGDFNLLDFHKISTLRSLTIGSTFNSSKSQNPDPFFGLVGELDRLQKSNNATTLETIMVHVTIGSDSVAPADEEWGKLDEVLAVQSGSDGGWPALREVVLEVELIVCMIGRDENKMQRVIEDQFHRLRASNSVVFESDVWTEIDCSSYDH